MKIETPIPRTTADQKNSFVHRNSACPPAISVIFSIIIMTIIMVIAGTMSASFLRANNRNLDFFRATQAYYMSRAAMEKALDDASGQGIGYENSEDTALKFDTVGDGASDIWGGYEIYSRAQQLDWQSGTGDTCSFLTNCYLIPIPGTGTAGEDCDFEDTSQDWNTDEDNSCNWNKIAYEETTSIPFFYADSTYADGYADPDDLTLTTFELRVRVPAGYSNLSEDGDVVLNWQFTAECDEDGDGIYETSCYLMPWVDSIFLEATESQIHEEDINDAVSSNYTVLDENSDGIDYIIKSSSIDEFLSGYLPEYNTNQIYLKLSVISTLIDIGGDQIPYLEYQIVTNQPISDNKILYSADGRAEGKQGTYVRHIQASQSIENDSVINFVIQN